MQSSAKDEKYCDSDDGEGSAIKNGEGRRQFSMLRVFHCTTIKKWKTVGAKVSIAELIALVSAKRP